MKVSEAEFRALFIRFKAVAVGLPPPAQVIILPQAMRSAHPPNDVLPELRYNLWRRTGGCNSPANISSPVDIVTADRQALSPTGSGSGRAGGAAGRGCCSTLLD